MWKKKRFSASESKKEILDNHRKVARWKIIRKMIARDKSVAILITSVTTREFI